MSSRVRGPWLLVLFAVVVTSFGFTASAAEIRSREVIRWAEEHKLPLDADVLNAIKRGMRMAQMQGGSPEAIKAFADRYIHEELAGQQSMQSRRALRAETTGLVAPQQPLSVNSISPSSGPTTGGALVFIRGFSFKPGVAVTFGGVPATSVTIDDCRTLRVTTPPAASPGPVNVVVTNPDLVSATLTNGFTYNTPPPPPPPPPTSTVTLTSITPNSGPTFGGTPVTIIGSGFTAGMFVSIGSRAAISVVVVDSNTITAVTPANVPGPASVSVSGSGGSAFLSNAFTYTGSNLPPTITSFDPSGTPGTTINIFGTNFIGVQSVEFVERQRHVGSGPFFTPSTFASFTVVSPTQITAVVPADAVDGPILVNTIFGVAATCSNFNVTPAGPPTITSVSSTSAYSTPDTASGFFINGSNFTDVQAVLVNGRPVGDFFVNSSRITAFPTVVNTTGPVTVITSAGQVTSTGIVAIVEPPFCEGPVPTVTGVTPPAAAPGQSVTISGSNFRPNSFDGPVIVAFANDRNLNVFRNAFPSTGATTISTVVPPSVTSGPITVVTDYGVTTSSPFTVVSPGPPTISTISPLSGVRTTDVTVTGTNLNGVYEVVIGGTTTLPLSATPTSLTFRVPLESASGAVTVVLNSLAGSASTTFNVTCNPPVITSFTPTSGPAGTSVCITGSNFVRGETIVVFTGARPTFGSVSAGGNQVCTSAPFGATTGPITVQTPWGVTISTASFTSGTAAAVTLTSVDPSSASVGRQVTLTLTGTGFQSGMTFNFGPGITVGGVTVNSTTQATVIITIAPDAASGPRSVTATLSGGQSSTLANGFTVLRNCPENALILSPQQGQKGVPTAGFFQYASRNASQIRVYFGPAGGGCQTLYTTTTGFASYSNLREGTEYEFRIEGFTPGCPVQASECIRFTTVTTCPAPPTLIAPAQGSTIASPVTFRWSAVERAIGYTLFVGVGNETPKQVGSTTTETQLTVDTASGAVNWYVIANVPGCAALQSPGGQFGSCSTPSVPIVAVVAETTSGQTYNVSWTASGESYELQEATNPFFNDARTTTTSARSVSFTKTATTPTAFYYRVRASVACQPGFSAFSDASRIVIVPPPPPTAPETSANVPAGSTRPVVVEVFVPGLSAPTPFSATVDKEFMSLEPRSGTMPPAGLTFRITLDPTTLPNGAFSGTVIVTFLDSSAGRRSTHAHIPPRTATVSITLATPASPARTTEVSRDTLVIPGLGHLEGVTSFRSDVRITNPSSAAASYELILTPANRDVLPKTVTIRVDPGATTALDDIVRRWFGLGSLPGESGTASLLIKPVTTGAARPSPVLASSRTFATDGKGTLGQFIPPVAFSKFIGTGGSALSLQQIAQNASSRSNIGLVEAAGESASVLLSVFDASGNKVRDIPVDVAAREQKNLNSLLAVEGITLDSGRIEVRVTSGKGRVTAFASVIDNASGDQFYTPAIILNEIGSTRYVFPGAARLTTPTANWRTDLRIFNAASTPQAAQVTFYPLGGTGVSKDVTVDAGDVLALNDVIGTLFNTTGGGAIHVSTPNSSNLVVTGRTYNLSGSGSTGQFISAVELEDGATAGGETLHLLQLEDSPRYRTNVGLAEMSGQPVTVELQVFLPDSKVSPTVAIPLAANEYRQFALREFGLGNVYNGRITVRVISGTGRVTAFGSLIDLQTGDATFLPAQTP